MIWEHRNLNNKILFHKKIPIEKLSDDLIPELDFRLYTVFLQQFPNVFFNSGSLRCMETLSNNHTIRNMHFVYYTLKPRLYTINLCCLCNNVKSFFEIILLSVLKFHVLKLIYSEKATKNFESPPIICPMYCQSNNWWRFRKILWPSQNMWTLTILFIRLTWK